MDSARVEGLPRRQWGSEQVAGHLRRTGRLLISRETIYRHVRQDEEEGGPLYTHLRGARKRRRQRYGAYDGRGRWAGRLMISGRPAKVEGAAMSGTGRPAPRRAQAVRTAS